MRVESAGTMPPSQGGGTGSIPVTRSIYMLQYILKSNYRFAILGLALCLIGLWYYWYRTEQIASPLALTEVTIFVLINMVLSYFSYNRHRYLTYFIFYFSYTLIAIVTYTVFALSRGFIK